MRSVCLVAQGFPGRRHCTLTSRVEQTTISVPSGVTRNRDHGSRGRFGGFLSVTGNSGSRLRARLVVDGQLECVARRSLRGRLSQYSRVNEVVSSLSSSLSWWLWGRMALRVIGRMALRAIGNKRHPPPLQTTTNHSPLHRTASHSPADTAYYTRPCFGVGMLMTRSNKPSVIVGRSLIKIVRTTRTDSGMNHVVNTGRKVGNVLRNSLISLGSRDTRGLRLITRAPSSTLNSIHVGPARSSYSTVFHTLGGLSMG